MTRKEIIERFICSGCICGSNTSCGNFFTERKTDRITIVRAKGCANHLTGTSMFCGGQIIRFAPRMPVGFSKSKNIDGEFENRFDIEVYTKDEIDEFKLELNYLNIPVWAMEEDGFLFVRIYSPRINLGRIAIVEDGTMDLVPEALDVKEFQSEID